MTDLCYIGIDLGLSRIKASAFDSNGHQLTSCGLATPRSIVSSLIHEVDMEELAHRVLLILRDVVTKVGSLGYQIAGLGVTGHGNGLYLVDENLVPVAPGIASSDGRALGYASRIPEDLQKEIHEATGSRPWAAQPLPLLRWIRDEQPEVYSRIRWVLCCKDWILASLTGVASTDYSDASACGILNLRSRKLSRIPFEAFGLVDAQDFVPSLHPSGDLVGGVLTTVAEFTGLPEGLPVIAGCMDCIASALGTGTRNPGEVTVIAGTWAINAVIGPSGPPPAVGMVALLPDPTQMLCMEVSPASVTNIDWLCGALGTPEEPQTISTLLAEADKVPPGADGLIFLPFVNGSGTTEPASGTFVGASSFHTRGHLVRAVLEGVAHYHRVQLERVVATGLVAPDQAWQLAGGGMKSTLWAQIFADIIRQRLHRHLDRELGALGVASLVARAVGQSDSGWFDGDHIDVFEPGPHSDFYQKQAATFDAVMLAMTPVWQIMTSAQELD
ncbi:MAG: carbohydrate kinase [Propionibacteriaceae bacterium]|jgi:L-xylulokinase|nr:carbohydrate kinase [Propionibacteriaceae bacterium]